MLTANTQFAIELGKLIEAEVMVLTDHIVSGVLSDQEYRRMAGKIAGLNKALELFDEAHQILEKR